MWKNGKRFAFTIVDDTDNSTIENVAPVYELLSECGIYTTKTVWVYPSRDQYTGGSLSDTDYLGFVKELEQKGFEIGLHNVGSGKFTRDEILQGLEDFKKFMGYYPKIHINHATNQDSIYWGSKRFSILSKLMRIKYGEKRTYYGDVPESSYFWGDVSKKYIKYIRNHVFNNINTLKYDSKMPYKVKSKDKFSNYWFSSTDANNVDEFNNLITDKNLDKLEAERGCCIIYTHFASGFVKNGKLNKEFESKIRSLGQKNAWFAPACEILDYLQERKTDEYASKSYLAKLDYFWIKDKVIKRIMR